MKNRKELDMDFIGGQGPMTKEEEAISDYFKSQKAKKGRHALKKTSSRKKLTV